MSRVVLSWSSGKDAAWALHTLRQRGTDVVELLTTVDESTGRVGMHGTPRDLVEAQAAAAGLPLRTVEIPWPCSNADYEARMGRAIAAVRDGGATHLAFGDLSLEDVRAHREGMLAGSGLRPLFPLWHPPGGTAALARAMVRGGLRAVLTCVDAALLGPSFVGRPYDAALLAALPAGVDPCGERGEFHTVCSDGPMFVHPVAVRAGATAEQGGSYIAAVAAHP